MPEENQERFRAELRELLETMEISDLLMTPVSDSIENILRIASGAVNSEGASVLIPAGDGGDLKFAWAIGAVSDLLMNITVPAGKGIAGFVFSTGQPMAVSDTEQETDFYAEVDRNTGFSTMSVLATPLQFGGEVIGVLEFVNRPGSPPYEPFSSEEMDLAAFYADTISALVNASESADLLGRLSEKMAVGEEGNDLKRLRAWLKSDEDGSREAEMMELALLVKEISANGERGRALCREILESVLRFSGGNADERFGNL